MKNLLAHPPTNLHKRTKTLTHANTHREGLEILRRAAGRVEQRRGLLALARVRIRPAGGQQTRTALAEATGVRDAVDKSGRKQIGERGMLYSTLFLSEKSNEVSLLFDPVLVCWCMCGNE
jgi:hypothetical protein